MTLARPYYRLHQIIAGQYAPAGELVLEDGTDYEGPYHVVPNGNLFSEYRPSNSSVRLYYKVADVHPTTKYYNKIKGIPQAVSNYTSPKYYLASPTSQDYADGYMYRYFVQKRTSPLSTIAEISYEDFTRANLSNAPGISLQLHKIASIKWVISKASAEEATILNKRAIMQAELEFTGITSYLTNPVEFYQDKVA